MITMYPPTKQCKNCFTFKTLDNFSRDKSRGDGLDRRCKQCHKDYDAARNVKASKQLNSRQKPFQNWTNEDIGAFRVPQR